ncbi:MAG: flagellar hook-basal body complex protein [bacterium]
MSQALFTAITGLKTSQTKLDVIADNIANMNTVGFKGSKVNFENIFVRTLTNGSSNTNPMQVGLGATLSEVSRNFSNGTVQTTGRTTDLNIQGDGFFTVKDPLGSISLTRAGNFSINGDGNLVTPQGLSVLGTANVVSPSGSVAPIRIPQTLKLSMPDAAAGDKITNACSGQAPAVSEGTFSFKIDDGLGSPTSVTTKTVTIDKNSTIESVRADIDALDGVTATITGNKLSIDIAPDEPSPGATAKVTFGDSGDSSNFFSVMGFNSLTLDPAASTPVTTTSSIGLKNTNKISIEPGDSSPSTYSMSSFSVGKDGAIEAVYSNGAKITVSGDPVRALSYKTVTGTEINGADITGANGGSVTAIKPQELQLQICNVANPKGLMSTSGNLFQFGPGSGNTMYGVGKAGGLGMVDSGALETANIDLPTEFSEMMLAQRGIEASSRVFSTQSQIMQSIINIGR